jgi:hypothetical protein
VIFSNVKSWGKQRSAGDEGSEESAGGKGLLEVATQIAGLFAAVGAVIYATGAIVLSLRLAFEELPWGNVVSQLPREFVLSIGTGQVLLPSLAIGALYGLFRLLRDDRRTAPKAYRLRDGGFRHGWRGKGVVVVRYLITWVLMLVPLALVLIARGDVSPSDLHVGLGFAIAGVVVLAAMAAQEGRAIVIRRNGTVKRWNGIGAALTLAGVYAAAALPAMVLAAAAVPLTEAKLCTTDNYEEHGTLVGETSDRVYIGERSPRPDHHRIAVVPMAKLEELFIGTDAKEATCEFEKASAPATGEQGEKGKGVDLPHNPAR